MKRKGKKKHRFSFDYNYDVFYCLYHWHSFSKKSDGCIWSTKYNTAHTHKHIHTQWTEYRKAIKKVFPFLMTALLFPMTMTIIINVDWLARFYEGMNEIKRKRKMKKNWSFYEGSRSRTIGIERWKWPLSRT